LAFDDCVGAYAAVVDDAERERRWEAHMADVAAGRFQGGPLPPPSAEGVRFAEVLANALAEDLSRHGPEAPLRRVDIVDFADPDPLNITVHALATTDALPDRFGENWDPLTWSNNEREYERSRRIVDRYDLRAAAEALQQTFPPVSDDHWLALYPQYWLASATGVTADILSTVLRDRGVALADEFEAESRSFED
jgi:hypothetical protein